MTTSSTNRIRVIIVGAAGRDFHDFNTFWRNDPRYEIVAFTAAQIPDIDGRTYPPELCGDRYPNGIPIEPEAMLTELIKRHDVQQVAMAYSDLPHAEVMHKAAIVNAAGADFRIMGHRHTMLKSTKPVIAVCAVRTGCGKSQTSRAVTSILKEMGKRVAAVRHPMPYGDLTKQICQRFAELSDLDKHKCTIEEREEYEPHIVSGVIVYAGVDYEMIIRQAEKEADVIVWDGGNNDMPFYKPDLMITVVDPHRPGHEIGYYPGQTNLLMADVIVINKIDSADADDIAEVRANIAAYNPEATVVDAASPLTVDNPEAIRGKKVLVVEDGPTLTHGEMAYGAGVVAAMKFGAAELVDPRPYTVKSITATFQKYPEIGTLLPAMGYGNRQIKDLQATINKVECDTVVVATPIDLTRLIKIRKPMVRVGYSLQEIGQPDLVHVLNQFLDNKAKRGAKKKA